MIQLTGERAMKEFQLLANWFQGSSVQPTDRLLLKFIQATLSLLRQDGVDRRVMSFLPRPLINSCRPSPASATIRTVQRFRQILDFPILE